MQGKTRGNKGHRDKEREKYDAVSRPARARGRDDTKTQMTAKK